MMHDERLLSAREAALELGTVVPRTAQLRARRALVAGDPMVRMIAGAYCAPMTWWERRSSSSHIDEGAH
jgi:hypothetical protein